MYLLDLIKTQLLLSSWCLATIRGKHISPNCQLTEDQGRTCVKGETEIETGKVKHFLYQCLELEN